MKSLFCVLVCSLALAACGVAPPAPPLMHTETVTVKTEVPVPCVSSIPQPAQPLLSDSDLLSGSGSQVADKLWVDHTVSKDYIGDLLAAVTACSKLPAQLPALK